jgi:hypothetical protein
VRRVRPRLAARREEEIDFAILAGFGLKWLGPGKVGVWD